jgi:sterol desaturase/sphingolipid hydroxylase (fatty acid hydroxylase superfamily)
MATAMAMAAELALCGAVGLGGGLLFAILHCATEVAWFHGLAWLQRRGHSRRLGPTTHGLFESPTARDFCTTLLAFSPIPAAMCACRSTFLHSCRFSLSPAEIQNALLFTWCVMVLHDAHFFLMHSALHAVKPVYRALHQFHHNSFGDITVFNTAYSEPLDVALCISLFYVLVVLWLHCARGAWNPLYLAFVLFAINNVHMMGHCGCTVPVWVYGPTSLGVLFTPGSQRPLHHYLHHVDPRCNRALYFTWCDKLAGTYLDTHPKLYKQ